MTGRPRLAAVIVHYRTPEDTARAVASLCDSTRPPDDVVVVNHDPDGTRPLTLPSSVVHLAVGNNAGFPAGANAGIAEARRRGARRILLLNSDATLDAGTLAALDEALDSRPGAGLVAPVVLDDARPPRVESMGVRYRPASGRMRLVGHGRPHRPERGGEVVPVDAVTGCAVLVDVSVFERIGSFDEEYFYGFEDLDFCLRARKAGFSPGVVTGVYARHAGARSIGAASAERLYYAARNHLRLSERVDAGTSRVRAGLRGLSIVGWNAAHAFRAPVSRVPARLAAVARGVRDYRRGRFGRA